MRRWLVLTIRLYPARWRARYGEEFHALLEQVNPGWRELADVSRGAILMQIADGRAFLRLAANLSVAGALIAAVLSFAVPRRYVSSAVVTVTPPKEDVDGFALSRAEQSQRNILSRSNLSGMIQNLNLYDEERTRLPIEDIMLEMRSRDIQITEIAGSAFRISFAYRDKAKARIVTRQLAEWFCESNFVAEKNRATLWHQFNTDLYRSDRETLPQPDPPSGLKVAILSPPNLPDVASAPSRWQFAGAGVLAGVFLALTIWRPKRALRVAACAATCGLAAFGLSFLVRPTYVSTATLRFAAPIIPERLAGVAIPSPEQRFEDLKKDLLSDENMARLLTQPSLELYWGWRARTPFAGLIERVRQNIRIRTGDPAGRSSFDISFSDFDPVTAKNVVNQLAARSMERTVVSTETLALSSGNPMLRTIAEHRVGENLEMLDAGDLPGAPVKPDRITYAAVGLCLGLLAGLLMSRPPAASSLLRASSSLACWLL